MIRRILILVLLSLPCWAQGAGYTYARSITISGSLASGTQTNFVVLVCENFTLGNGNSCQSDSWPKTVGNGGRLQNASGFDRVYFANSNCTSQLAFETDAGTYSASAGSFMDYVQIPGAVALASHVFYVCYGNASISTFQGGATGAAWDGTFAAVYHWPVLSGNCLASNIPDSTANANNLSIPSLGTLTCPLGQLYGSAMNTGTSTGAYFNTPDAASLDITSKITMSSWVNVISYPSSTWGIVIAKNDSVGSFFYDYNFGINGPGLGTGTTGQVYVITGAPFTIYHGTALVPTGAWHFLTVTIDETLGSNKLKIFIDGALDSTPSYSSTMATDTDPLGLMSDGTVGSTKGLTGSVDESRIENVARPASWISSEYNNESTPATFYTFGSEMGGGTTRKRSQVINP